MRIYTFVFAIATFKLFSSLPKSSTTFNFGYIIQRFKEKAEEYGIRVEETRR
jgi:transposase